MSTYTATDQLWEFDGTILMQERDGAPIGASRESVVLRKWVSDDPAEPAWWRPVEWDATGGEMPKPNETEAARRQHEC